MYSIVQELEVKQLKNNFFKYIFVIVVISLIGYAIFYFYNNQKDEQENIEEETQEVSTTILNDIRFAIVDFDSINPLLSNNQDIQDVSRLIYEPLLSINKDYSLNLCLAKEWTKVDATTYLITLKQGIKWHNGFDFTAQDVKFTIDALKSGKFSSIYTANVNNIVSLDIVDNYTLRIGLDKETDFFEYNLTFPIMSNDYYLEEEFSTSSKNTNPIGTGKYKISSVEDSVITLKKNNNWWNIENEDSRINEIVLKKYNSMGEAYNAFKLGNIDMITTKSLNVEEYIGTVGYKTEAYKGRNYDFIAINCNNVALSDSSVRNAIAYSIDKYNIISEVYNNKYFSSDFPLDYGSYLYSIEKADSGYNQEKSKELLRNAGWIYSNNSWTKKIDNKTYTTKFNLVVKSSEENRVRVAENIKNQLEQIGISINIVQVSDAQYNQYLNNKNYDMILTGIIRGYSPNLSTYFGSGNLANFNNEEANKTIQEIQNITDNKILKEKYNRLIEIYETEQPYISLYYNRNSIVYTPNLMGKIEANIYNIFYNIGGWYREY